MHLGQHSCTTKRIPSTHSPGSNAECLSLAERQLTETEKLALRSSSNSTVPHLYPSTTPDEKKKGHACMTCTLVSGTSSMTNSDYNMKNEEHCLCCN